MNAGIGMISGEQRTGPADLSPLSRRGLPAAAAALVLSALYMSSRHNYLLFHTLIELFTVVVLLVIFVLAWNTRRVQENRYLLFIGVSSFFIASLQLVHALAYKGMGIFPGNDANMATQLWIAGRYLFSLTFLAAPLFISRRLSVPAAFTGYAFITWLIFWAIFSGSFPDCFVEGSGLTPFKIYSEYAIIAIFLAAAGMFAWKRKAVDRKVLRLIMLSIASSAAAELAFTHYISVYGTANLAGHFLLFASMVFVYRAIIVTGIIEPSKLLFRNLTLSEEALRISEEKYRSLFENMIDGFAYHRIIADERGKPADYVFLEVNGAFERLTGMRREAIIGRTVRAVLPGIENDPADWIGTYGKVALTGADIRFEQHALPLDRWFSVSAYSPMKEHFVAVFEDITDRKRMEFALRESREQLERRVEERTAQLAEQSRKLEAFFRHSLTPMAFLDREFNFIRVNEAYALACDRDASSFAGRNHFAEYPSDDLKERFEEVVRTGAPYSVFERPFVFPDRPEWGTTYWDLFVNPTRNADGKVDFLVLSLNDVTGRVRDQAQLLRLAAAVESVAEAIVLTGPRGTVEYVNPAFTTITGYSRDEIVGRDLHVLDSGRHDDEFYRAMREASDRDGVWNGQLINKRKDGSLYFEECTISPVRESSGTVTNYVAVKRDVTEKLRLESIAESISAMDNIGFVFSGVRHEIGNPINSLNMILGILRAKFDTLSSSAVKEYLVRMTEQVSRVMYILQSLKSFNLFETQEREEVPVLPFMEKFLPLVREDFAKRGISIDISVSPDAKRFYADPRALQQVLLNIMTNAADALDGRTAPRVAVQVDREGERVVFRVRDNGIGIPEDRLKDIFKPFYTTRKQGTGLGLVIVRKMLAKMNGTITIQSRNGEGTIVTITLPEPEDPHEKR